MTKKNNVKKILVCIIMCCIMLVFQNTAFAAQPMKIKYDGKTVKYTGITYTITINAKEVKTDFPGIDFNKTTMFPLRAVFEQMGGKAVWNSKAQIMDITYNGEKYQFKNNSANVIINGKNIKLSAPVKKINDRLVVPVDFFKNVKNSNVVIATRSKTIQIDIQTVGSIQEISSSTTGEKDVIVLKMNNHKGYEVSRLTNPNRIIVDFKNVKSQDEEKTIETDLNRISEIKYSSLGKDSTRLVATLKEMDNYTVEPIADGCKVIVEKPINAQLSYVNNQDRVYFKLSGIKLANVSSTISNFFTEEYDNNKYTMTIPASSHISLEEETFNINDSNVSTINIFRDKETDDTKIVFHTKREFKFFTSYNEKYRHSEINLLTPANENERLVVIDAGHGDQDSGASVGDAKEKDLNLGIALKLEKLLKDNNVKTYMLRQDDTFVSLYDRPYIANELNATLFLSIHNNSVDSTKVSGTETLYYPEKAGDTSFTGQKFARKLQDSLIANLNTVNRKTVERPGLVVLKYTKMPSSLVEVGFLTNPTELQKLQDESFQQKTAQALCNAILESLKQIESEKNSEQIDPQE